MLWKYLWWRVLVDRLESKKGATGEKLFKLQTHLEMHCCMLIVALVHICMCIVAHLKLNCCTFASVLMHIWRCIVVHLKVHCCTFEGAPQTPQRYFLQLVDCLSLIQTTSLAKYQRQDHQFFLLLLFIATCVSCSLIKTFYFEMMTYSLVAQVQRPELFNLEPLCWHFSFFRLLS